MPTSTLTVHIGAPKTGTTWIQRFLYENRDTLLREQGVLYPDVNLRGYGHHDLAFLLGGGYPRWATPQPRTLADLHHDMARAAATHEGDILLSSEDFYLFPEPVALRRFLAETGASAGRAVRIVVYVRRQDEAHESWYNQTVKAQGEIHTVEACIERDFDLWDYHGRLASWAETFGREAIVVRPYDRAAWQEGTLRADFLHHAGITDRGLVAPPGDVNWSLNRDLLAFQRVVNFLPVSPVTKRRWHRQLMDLSRASTGSGRFDESPLLDAGQRAELLARYQASNAALARDYCGGSPFIAVAAQDPGVAREQGRGLTVGKVTRIISWLCRHD